MQKIRQVVMSSKDHFLPGKSKKAADTQQRDDHSGLDKQLTILFSF